MTTFDNPSVAQFLVYKLGRSIAKRKDAKATNVATQAYAWISTTVRLMLQLAGFGCLTYAGFQWSTIAGFVVAGVSFFVLSWLTSSPTPQPVPADPMANRRS